MQHFTDEKCKDSANMRFGNHSTFKTKKPRHITLEDVVVVNKPSGVPITPTVDNVVENMSEYVKRTLMNGKQFYLNSYDKKWQNSFPDVHVVSRLDVCTEGLTPMAVGKSCAISLHKLISERKILKTYRLLCRGPVQLGLLRHRYKRIKKSSIPAIIRPFESAEGMCTDNNLVMKIHELIYRRK
jgi:23S rRNA-/tRNA-specific pseudouridylate synthase